MSGNKKKLKKVFITIATVLSVAMMLLPALIGGGFAVSGGAAMAVGHGLRGSVNIGPLELLISDQPIKECWFHWVMLGALALFILLFIICGTKNRRKMCLCIWIVFLLATLSFTYFMECKICLALLILCAVALIVMLIVLILIWQRMEVKTDNSAGDGPLISENYDGFNIEDARLYVTGKSGYNGELVFLDIEGDGEYIEEIEDEDREDKENRIEEQTVEVDGGTTTTTRTIRKVTTVTTTRADDEEREFLLERERIERERLEEQRKEQDRLAKERKELESQRKELERETKERERQERERERLEREKQDRERQERERLEKERLDAERRELENQRKEVESQKRQVEQERERLERERLEEERKEQERLEHERIEEERRAREAAEKREAAKRIADLNAAEAKKAEDERKAKRELEIAAENARIETEREFYASGAAKPPSFKLSREDVLDRVDDMAENSYDYPIPANARLRSSDKAPDSLRAGVWTFGVMYESKAGVIKFFARMDKRYVQKLKKDHPTITASAFSGSEDWYKVIIDSTYYSKREVFSMIDNWYAYVATRYYSYDAVNKKYMTDETAAALAESTIVAAIMREITQPDPDLVKAEEELIAAEAAMLAAGSLKLTKKEIAKAVGARFGKKVEIAQRPDLTRTNLPLADTYYTQGISDKGVEKRVCYAYVYRLKNESVKIIVKLPRVYAEKQAETHTNMCRSKFPSGKGWYVSIIDGTYKSDSEVYTILARGKAFVESTEDRD